MEKWKIREDVEAFLSDWDRHAWMRNHGTWASEQWSDAREEYDEACKEVDDLPDGDSLDSDGHRDALAAVERLRAAIEALDSQVLPDDADYIAEGRIDPDEVADRSGDCLVETRWQGWDCNEGWGAYRVGTALYVHWWRSAYGQRHERDLWVQVEADYFPGEKEDEPPVEWVEIKRSDAEGRPLDPEIWTVDTLDQIASVEAWLRQIGVERAPVYRGEPGPDATPTGMFVYAR